MQAIGGAIGRRLRFQELSRDAAREPLSAWMPPDDVDGMLDVLATFATEPERITTTVQEITGAPARTFGQWAIDHAADFR